MKSFASATCLAAALFAALTSAAPAFAGGHHGRHSHHGRGDHAHRHFDHRGRDRHRHDDRGRRHHGYYRGRRGDGEGSVLAAGALGVVLGTVIADSSAHRDYAQEHIHDQAWRDHCASRYRSFDPASGTYLGDDHRRHYCR